MQLCEYVLFYGTGCNGDQYPLSFFGTLGWVQSPGLGSKALVSKGCVCVFGQRAKCSPGQLGFPDGSRSKLKIGIQNHLLWLIQFWQRLVSEKYRGDISPLHVSICRFVSIYKGYLAFPLND